MQKSNKFISKIKYILIGIFVLFLLVSVVFSLSISDSNYINDNLNVAYASSEDPVISFGKYIDSSSIESMSKENSTGEFVFDYGNWFTQLNSKLGIKLTIADNVFTINNHSKNETSTQTETGYSLAKQLSTSGEQTVFTYSNNDREYVNIENETALDPVVAPISFTLIINSFTISGTTWYGEELTDVKIDFTSEDYMNVVNDFVAGNYIINSVGYSLTYSNTYAVQVDEYFRKDEESSGYICTERTHTFSTKTISNQVSSLSVEIPFFITSNIEIDSYGTLSGAFDDDSLYTGATYQANKNWADNVQLSGTSTENYFYYSYADNSRKIFSGDGIFNSTIKNNNTDSFSTSGYSLELSINGGTLKSNLELKWYVDELLATPVTDGIVSAGTYYLCIEILYTNNTLDYTLNGEEKTINFVKFIKDDVNYVQPFTVEKAELKLDATNEFGIKFAKNGVPYNINNTYTSIKLPKKYVGQTIPENQYYLFNDDTNEYEVASGEFSQGVGDNSYTYYVVGLSADSMLSVSMDESIWAKIGGYADDYNSYVNGNSSLFDFAGTHFYSNDIGIHNKINLSIVITQEYVKSNYKVNLGTYIGDDFSIFESFFNNAEGSGLSACTLNDFLASSETDELLVYDYYGNFEITPPEVLIDTSTFQENSNSIFYGEALINSEMNYSDITFLNNVTYDDAEGKFNVITSETNWMVTFIKQTSQIVENDKYNVAYVLLSVAKKSSTGEFIKDGERYSVENNDFYAGEYYIIYDVYTVFKGENVIKNLDVNEGKCRVLNDDEVCMFVLDMSAIPLFTVNKVEIYLELVDYVKDKYYDGTNKVLDANGDDAKVEIRLAKNYGLSNKVASKGYENIFEFDTTDAPYIDYSCGLFYSFSMASFEDISIYSDLYLSQSKNWHGGTDTPDAVMNSYEIRFGIFNENGEFLSLYGKINHLTLDLQFVKDVYQQVDANNIDYVSDIYYYREYNKETFVAIKVANFDDSMNSATYDTVKDWYEALYSTEPEVDEYADYYYFYDQTTNEGKYYFYDKLPYINNGRTYVLIELLAPTENYHGFLQGESFAWEEDTTDQPFNKDRETDNLLQILTYNFVDWDFNEGITVSSSTKAGEYTLAIDDQFTIGSYKIIGKGYSKTKIKITKLTLNPENVFNVNVEDSSVNRYLIYDKNSKKDMVITNDESTTFLTFFGHNEYSQIKETYTGRYDEFISVSGFAIEYFAEESGLNTVYDPNELPSDVTNMVWAGTYSLSITLPPTDNYREVSIDIVVIVHPAQISVYSTIGIRTYMPIYNVDNELKIGQTLSLTESELSNRIKYVDKNNGDIYDTQENSGYSQVYVYYDEELKINTDNINIYYVGFLADDEFEDGDVQAVMDLDVPFKTNNVDAAGYYLGVVKLSGANKYNYLFNYVDGDLLVLKQSLNLIADGNQQVSFRGKNTNLLPDYEIKNKVNENVDGSLTSYIAAYYSYSDEDKYKLYVKDYSDPSNIHIREAHIAENYETLNDYYFYFLNDAGEQIFIYHDSTNYFYYDNNDNVTVKTITGDIELNFNNTDENGRLVDYIDQIDIDGGAKNIYLMVNEDENASVKDTEVKEVFYFEGNIGGYILKAYASPNTGSGASTSNYERSSTKVIIFTVKVLEISLIETVGETIYPIIHDEYDNTEFKFSSIGSYYQGIDLKGNSVTIDSSWGKVEYVIDNGVKEFDYFWDTGAFEDEYKYKEQFEKYNNDYNSSNFSFAGDGTIVSNAGLYVILAKVTINDGTFENNSTGDMRNNIVFKSKNAQLKFRGQIKESDNFYETYFVMYLVMNRADSVNVGVSGEGVSPEDFDLDGTIDGFSKTYNAVETKFYNSMTVLNQESSKGEILNVRAYLTKDISGTNKQLYFKSVENYLLANLQVGDDISNSAYYVKDTNGEYVVTMDTEAQDGVEYYQRTTEIIYQDLTGYDEISLIDANEFYLMFYVNFDDRRENNYINYTYNNNFVMIEKLFCIKIYPKDIRVYIDAIDDKNYKYYGQKNSEIENNFTFRYSGWVNEEERELYEPNIIGMAIDWVKSNLASNDDLEGEYVACGSKTLYVVDNATIEGSSNYALDISTATLSFSVKKLQLGIGDGTECPCVVIEKEKEYIGEGVEPNVERYGFDGKSLDNSVESDDKYSEGIGITITVIKKLTNYKITGEYDEDKLQHLQGTDFIGRDAVDVGYYLLLINVPDSKNYLGLEFYWVFEITKSKLTISFVDTSNNNEKSRGYAEKIYAGEDIVYPNYSIAYSGFRGEDVDGYENLVQSISYLYYSDGINYDVNIPAIGLVNPFYVFVDLNTGEEIRDTEGNPMLPTIRGTYYIKIDLSNKDKYGYANNYDMEVEYYTDEEGNVLYPEFVITPRKVSVEYDAMQNAKIAKTYDGTANVNVDSVTNNNYTFNRLPGEINSGLIEGDFISLNVNYASSMYARSDVYDEFGEMSIIEVYLSFNAQLLGEDANNYELYVDASSDNAHVIGGTTYIKLYGIINPASAVVRFYQGEQIMTSRIREVYDGTPKDVKVIVSGVNGEILTIENGGYVIKYVSEESNYDKAEAPSNCDTYVVTVTITDTNYSPASNSIDLIIGQAEVDIIFGGDGVQIYGDVTEGLTAMAISVNGYQKLLEVVYYVYNEDGTQGELVEDISVAPVGVYYVVAEHIETTNYAYKKDAEIFTIIRREVHINYDVASYYKYTGTAVNILMYFIDATVTYTPQLLFDVIKNGSAHPYNYTIDETGSIVSVTNNYPKNAGLYRVKAYEIYGNYTILDSVWCDFEIRKADLVVSIADTKVNDNNTNFNFELVLVGALTNDSVDKIVSNVKYKYYDAKTGVEIQGKPAIAGQYKVICYDAQSENYNLTYNFGMLTINKSVIETNINNGNDLENNILLEGSFDNDMSINITKKQNPDYLDMSKTYQSYQSENSEFANHRLTDIYVFEYVNYVPSTSGNSLTIKIHKNELLGVLSIDENVADSKIYVSVLDENGEITIKEAKLSGDHVTFSVDSTQIKAVSVLTAEAERMDNGLDWILYLGIAIAVMLIAISIIIVVKKS